jgi:hypothetical protein
MAVFACYSPKHSRRVAWAADNVGPVFNGVEAAEFRGPGSAAAR